MIEYKKGNLFDAPEGVYLLHACNAMGAWGAGIALQFKSKFPEDYKQYHNWCNQPGNRSGDVLVTENNVICLVTSKKWGKWKDCPTKILTNTRKALGVLVDINNDLNMEIKEIHMPKINAGLFNVPWEQTEAVIKEVLDGSSINVIVWEFE